jgi:hypothetical protein
MTDLHYRPAMSERSIYLRDQAQKCMRHAEAVSDAFTQAHLAQLVREK